MENEDIYDLDNEERYGDRSAAILDRNTGEYYYLDAGGRRVDEDES